MKWYYLIILFSFNTLKAQSLKTFSDSSYIKSYCLDITDNKTTNLIFPSAIKSVDRGSKDILAQKAGGIDNILRVKADIKNFPETNLTVITADGKLYSFVVVYNPHPVYQSINIETSPVIYSVPEINRPVLAEYCLGITDSPANIHSLKDSHAKVSIALNALYNKDDVLFCRLVFHNRAALNYDVDQFRFYIRDQKKSKRTASQEIEIRPLYISGDTITIKGYSHLTWVVALTKFTIPDEKYLAIEVMEKNGGRNLFIKVKNRHIMKTENLK
ncbi:MAG: conjugative transposon protein TraN [Segetibacter sp.]